MKKKWKKHIKKWFHYNVLLFGNLSAIAQQTLRLIHSAKIRFAFLLVLFGQLIGCDGFAWSGRYLHIAKVTHRCDRYRSPFILKATNINVFLFQADTMTRSNSKLILLPIKCDLRNLSFMQFLSFRSSAIACNTIFFSMEFFSFGCSCLHYNSFLCISIYNEIKIVLQTASEHRKRKTRRKKWKTC